MAIRPMCDKCKKELIAFGAILFSPPDNDSKVRKLHICVDCYDEYVDVIDNPTLVE